MRTNRVKQALKAGETVVGTMMVECRAPEIARLLARAGFDFIFIDLEHGAFSIETTSDLIRMMRVSDAVPLVRVTNNEYDLLARALDIGAMGFMVPRTETAEQARRMVHFTTYPPHGVRGGAIRAANDEYDGTPPAEFLERANEETLRIAQIESTTALDNLDEMLAVDGIDVALVGPFDLSVSFGAPGQLDHPKVRAGIEHVAETAARHGVASGIHVEDVNLLVQCRQMGMQMLTYSSDASLMMTQARASLGELASRLAELK